MSGPSPYLPADVFRLGDRPPTDDAGRRTLARARRLAAPRGQCRFHRLTFPVGMTTRARDQAARLYAEANAPFPASDFVIVRGKDAAAVWWWDRAVVEQALGDVRAYRAGDVLPETLFQPPAEGVRCVDLGDGYDAQIWEGGELVATSWRRRAFSNDQWAAFLVAGGVDASVAPTPSPVAATHDARARMIARIARPPLGWPDVQRAALWTTAIGLVLTGGLTGLGLGWSGKAESLRAALVATEAAQDSDPMFRRARADLAAVRSYQAQMATPDALGLAAHALATLRGLNVTPTVWAVEGARLTIEYPVGAGAPANTVAAALEADPAFANVTPRVDTDLGVVRLTADVTPRAGGAS
ncbi:MAG: hypothetical protein KJS97_15930 [Alphaproteobacteria bacterium]|nr:hypothetical protein [Alphaproteobacteria bacterium]